MAHANKRAMEDRILEALPDWVNTITQLNALVAERMGVVASDLDCLHVLDRLGPATASMLAKHVGLTAGSVSRMVDRLDAAGCIKRVRDPDDRRRVLIEPTTEGLNRIAAYYDGLTSRTHDDLEVFEEDELHSLLRFIHRSRDSAATEVSRLRAGSTGE